MKPMTYKEILKNQIAWIKSGKIGCSFASALVNHHNDIGWLFQIDQDKLIIPSECFILSIIFPDSNIEKVKQWALNNGMYIEDIDDMYQGLRIKCGDAVSWVQYFGSDSHVKTRQAPYPMLSFTCKLPAKYYHKVGFNGIYHLAHASISKIKEKASHTLWDRSIAKTKKELGHSPTIREAAKTTYEK